MSYKFLITSLSQLTYDIFPSLEIFKPWLDSNTYVTDIPEVMALLWKCLASVLWAELWNTQDEIIIPFVLKLSEFLKNPFCVQTLLKRDKYNLPTANKEIS